MIPKQTGAGTNILPLPAQTEIDPESLEILHSLKKKKSNDKAREENLWLKLTSRGKLGGQTRGSTEHELPPPPPTPDATPAPHTHLCPPHPPLQPCREGTCRGVCRQHRACGRCGLRETVPTATLRGLSFQLTAWLWQVLSVTVPVSNSQDERFEKSFLLGWPLLPLQAPMGSGFSSSLISSHSPGKFRTLSKVHFPSSTQRLLSSPESVS